MNHHPHPLPLNLKLRHFIGDIPSCICKPNSLPRLLKDVVAVADLRSGCRSRVAEVNSAGGTVPRTIQGYPHPKTVHHGGERVHHCDFVVNRLSGTIPWLTHSNSKKTISTSNYHTSFRRPAIVPPLQYHECCFDPHIDSGPARSSSSGVSQVESVAVRRTDGRNNA